MLVQQVAPKGITEVQGWQGTLKTSWRKWLPKLQPKLNLRAREGLWAEEYRLPHSHPTRASLAWRTAACPLPSCLPLEGDADQLEPHSLLLRPNEGRTGGVAFWGPGGSCCSQTRRRRISLPVEDLGREADSWASVVFARPALPPFSQERGFWLSLARGESRGWCCSNLVVDPGEGKCWAWHRIIQGWPSLG